MGPIPHGQSPFMEGCTGTSRAGRARVGPSFCRGGSKRCLPCPEPPAGPRHRQKVKSPGRQDLGQPLLTPNVPKAPKLGGTGLVVGRPFSPPPSQSPVAYGDLEPSILTLQPWAYLTIFWTPGYILGSQSSRKAVQEDVPAVPLILTGPPSGH